MSRPHDSAAAAAAAEILEMLPPASTSLENGDPEPPWFAEFVSARVQAANARADLGWAVEKVLRAATARCVHCSVDHLSCLVQPPILQRIENTQAEREENRFEASQLRRAAMQAGAKMEGARTPSRIKHFAKTEKDLRRQLRELDQADRLHANMLDLLLPLRDFLKKLIRTRLEVDPAKLQSDVDRILVLGLSGKDLSMEGTGTILHTAAESGQMDAIHGWLKLLADGNSSDSDDDDAQPDDRTLPVVDEKYVGKRVAVVETSSPHFGRCGIATSVSLRAGLVSIAFDDGTSSRLKSEHVRRHDQKTDAEIEYERAYQLHSPGAVEHDRLGAVHIDARSPNGTTPLYAAAYAGHCNVVELLLRERADVHATRDDGCTPMHAAARNGHCEVVETLIEGGADINRPGKHGATPLCMLVAGLQRARLCARAKDAKLAEFARSVAGVQTAMGNPMNANEFDSGRACMTEKTEAVAKMKRLERTLLHFVEYGRQVERVQRAARRMFRKYDKNHSGHLSKMELKRMFNGRVEKRYNEVSKTLVDYTDENGGIQWLGFWRWWWVQHKNGLWLPDTAQGKVDHSDAMEFGYQAAFLNESVEALRRDRFYTGMIPLLEGMVAQARSDAKSAEALALAESEERQQREYARQQEEWQKRMRAANAETRRKRTAVWRTDSGRALLTTLHAAQAANLISEREMGNLKLKVQSGIIDVIELERTWKRKWLLHCTHKGIASANSAPLVSKRKNRQPALLRLISESSGAKESAQPPASWFDVQRHMFGSIPPITIQESLQLSQPDGYDRRRVLTKGIRFLVDELHAQSSDNRALALWALAMLCGPNTAEGIRNRQLIIDTKAVKQIASLLMHRGARQSEVNLCGPAILAMLIYEDKCIASAVQSTGCIRTLVDLIELDSHVETRTTILCCLVNLAVDPSCRRECRRLGLTQLVRPLCLEQNEAASVGLILLDCLSEPSQLDPAAASKQAEKDMLNSPEVTRAREALASPHGSLILPSVCTSDSSASASSSASQSVLEELTIELPFLIHDFPNVDPCDIRSICERAGGITDAALTQLTALNQQHPESQKTHMDKATESNMCLAIDEAESKIEHIQSHRTKNAESARATESFNAFSFVDNLHSVKSAPELKTPARPPHILGGLLGNKATENDVEETFNAFDADGDGVLSASELKNGLWSLGLKFSPEEIDGVVAVLDVDGNGEIDIREFCRHFQRWAGGQLSNDEQRTLQWHSKPVHLARKSQIKAVRKVHSIKPSIGEALLDDPIDQISQAIVAERDARLAKTVAKDRKRIRAAVAQVHKVYQRSDELAQLSENARDQKRKDVEAARHGMREFSKQQQKLLSEIQRTKDKIATLAAATTHGGFVHQIDYTNPAGTPTIARRWLELGHGRLVWRFGHEQLLDEAASVSRFITQTQEPKPTPSKLSTKTGNKMQLVVEGAGDESVPGWVTEAREKLQSEQEEYALSPLKSPLSTHKSFSRLSPLVSPAVRSPKLGSSLSPGSTKSSKSPKNKRRRRADITSWDSPLGLKPSSNHDLLSVAELALSVVTQEPALVCCTENDAAEYIEAKEKRERLRKSARDAGRPMPKFEPVVLETSHHSHVIRVVLGAPDSAGQNVYNFVVSNVKELEQWKATLQAGIDFAASHSYWDERLRQLRAKSVEASGRVAVWQRSFSKAEQALEKVSDNADQIQEACTRAEDLVEWSVVEELTTTACNQARLKAEQTADLLQNEFWPGVPLGHKRVASMLLADGQSVH